MKQVYKNIKNWYDNNIDTYLKSGDVLMQDKLDKFLGYVPENGKILDIGSGTGRDVKYFTEKGYSGFGIDFSGKMVNYARENSRGKFYLMKMTHLTFKDNYFDGIWSSSSLFTHLMPKDIQIALQEVKRTLKDGGVFGAIAMKKKKGDRESKKFVFNKFSEKEILSQLADNGLNPFYVEKFPAHKREWFYILSKKL